MYFGWTFGSQEFGVFGGVVGILAGGFVGLIGGYVLMIGLGLGFMLLLILGPLAVILALAYLGVKSYAPELLE